MKKLLFLIFISFIFSCLSDRNEFDNQNSNESIKKIMPLGASRVEGDRPNYESYRFNLWKYLKQDNLYFDFVGTQSDYSYYPTFDGEEFDIDHEGRGGWTSGDILDEIGNWLIETETPDIVLFSSPGGNDALEELPFSQAINNINSIIDILQSENPNIIIIIEQMAPARSDIMSDELTYYIEQMHLEILNISTVKTTNTSQVIAIDMFTDFNDSLLADDVHYNELGAQFIAFRYYNLLTNLIE